MRAIFTRPKAGNDSHLKIIDRRGEGSSGRLNAIEQSRACGATDLSLQSLQLVDGARHIVPVTSSFACLATPSTCRARAASVVAAAVGAELVKQSREVVVLVQGAVLQVVSVRTGAGAALSLRQRAHKRHQLVGQALTLQGRQQHQIYKGWADVKKRMCSFASNKTK